MRNRFTIGDNVYTDAVIMGGVDYGIDISGDELTVGVAACGVLRFTVRADNNPFSVGTEFVWERKQIDDVSFATMGEFTVQTVTKQGNRYLVESFDGMAKFDVVVDEWMNNLSYPITHEAMLTALCGHVGVELDENTDLTCGDRIALFSPSWEGATGREILAFLAEASGCFALMCASGKLYVGWYTDSGVNLTSANYTEPFTADYTVSSIDSLQVRATVNDIGIIVGDGANTYVIEGNPLFYTESDDDLRPYAERLLDKLSGEVYRPCEVPLYNDRGLRPGDIFTIDGQRALVMFYRCTERGTVISCDGSKKRPVQSTLRNREVMQLIGKTNELERTVEETRSTLTERIDEAEQELKTIIDQTSRSILLEVSNTYATDGELQEAISTQLKVLEDSVAIQFRTLQAVVDENGTDTQTRFAELYKYIKFEGGAITLGSSDSAITLTVENDMIVFRRNGVQFGWWDGVDFHTGNIVVEVSQRAQFGNFAFVPRGDGSLSFVKVGE
jgi:hypothetical protein